MDRFTTFVGATVVDADGRSLGRLLDLTVGHRHDHPRVHDLVVGRRHRIEHLVPWLGVDAVSPSRITLLPGAEVETVDASAADEAILEADELLLRRDVLDAQIVDVVGHRVARVGDVLLADEHEAPAPSPPTVGGRPSWRAVAVDVSPGAIAARLARPLGRFPWRTDAIAWTDLHLTSARGHQVQLGSPAAAVHHLDDRGLAALVTRLPVLAGADVLTRVGSTRGAGAVAHLHHDVGRRVVSAMDVDEANALVDALPESHTHLYRDVLRRAMHPRGPKTERPYLRHAVLRRRGRKHARR